MHVNEIIEEIAVTGIMLISGVVMALLLSLPFLIPIVVAFMIFKCAI